MDKFKILLVDDDQEMHESIPELLQEDRLEFHHSHSFKDSVVKLASSHYDLLICDYDLGVKSGIDLANISKKYRPNTAIFLLVVNYEFSSVHPLAIEAKVSECFEKPFNPENLIEGILNLVNKKFDLLKTPTIEPQVVIPESVKASVVAPPDNLPDQYIEEVSSITDNLLKSDKLEQIEVVSDKKRLTFSDVDPSIIRQKSAKVVEESIFLPPEISDSISKPIEEKNPSEVALSTVKDINQEIEVQELNSQIEKIQPEPTLSLEEEEEEFDLSEFTKLLEKPKKDIKSSLPDELDLPEPTKSVDSDLIEAPPSIEVQDPIEEKTFERPSAFKTLDGNEVQLKEVNETTSLNLKAVQEDLNEKVAVEESNAFLAELVNEVTQVESIEAKDLDRLGSMKKVKISSIQDEINTKELQKEEISQSQAIATQETLIQKAAETPEVENSEFGFSSSPVPSNQDFDIEFNDLSADVHSINQEQQIQTNPFECKFPKERPRKDPYLRVVIAQNILSAALVCYPLEDDHHTMESVKKELELKNVVYNIDFELIEKLIQRVNLMREPILGEIIATGHPAVHGKNGKIDLSFSNSLDVDLSEAVDGKVDFKNIYKIDCVRKGEFLAEIIPPTMAIPGTGVTGFVLKGKNGKPKPILPGKGARFDKTTQKFYATIEGQPFLRGNKLIVSPLYVVPNGVDYSTGNISFVGSVHICGDVASGFTVEAEGDILVEGIVEGAILKAGGSVKVQRGFAGAEKGEIYAEGEVRCKYISNGTVEAGGSIIVEDSIINSTVTSLAKVKVFNKKGNILGGLVRAQESVRVLNLGSEFGVGTKIIVGSHFVLREKLGEVNKAQKLNSLKMDKISKGIQSFTNLVSGKSLDKSHMVKLKQLKAILKKLKMDEDSFEAKKDELLKEFNKKCMSKIYVRNQAHPGVSVQIGNTVYALNDIFTNCSFFEDRFKAVVKLGVYEEE